jgi:hypothetical protein
MICREQPDPELRIFDGGKRFVEQSDLLKDLCSEERTGWATDLRVSIVVDSPVRDPSRMCPLHFIYLTLGSVDAGTTWWLVPECFDETFDRILVEAVVIIQKQDILSRCLLYRDVPGVTETTWPITGDYTKTIITYRIQQLRCLIGGTSIDNDALQVRMCLIEDTPDCIFEKLCPIVSWNYCTYCWHFLSPHSVIVA